MEYNLYSKVSDSHRLTIGKNGFRVTDSGFPQINVFFNFIQVISGITEGVPIDISDLTKYWQFSVSYLSEYTFSPKTVTIGISEQQGGSGYLALIRLNVIDGFKNSLLAKDAQLGI